MTYGDICTAYSALGASTPIGIDGNITRDQIFTAPEGRFYNILATGGNYKRPGIVASAMGTDSLRYTQNRTVDLASGAHLEMVADRGMPRIGKFSKKIDGVFWTYNGCFDHAGLASGYGELERGGAPVYQGYFKEGYFCGGGELHLGDALPGINNAVLRGGFKNGTFFGAGAVHSAESPALLITKAGDVLSFTDFGRDRGTARAMNCYNTLLKKQREWYFDQLTGIDRGAVAKDDESYVELRELSIRGSAAATYLLCHIALGAILGFPPEKESCGRDVKNYISESGDVYMRDMVASVWDAVWLDYRKRYNELNYHYQRRAKRDVK